MLRLFAEQLPGELGGVEGEEILRLLADAEELDGDVDRLVYREDDATLRRAVELRHHQPRYRYRGAEGLRLLHRVLADGAVEHQQGLVWRAGKSLRDHPRNLLEFVHQPFTGVQPPRGVDDEHVGTARDGGVDGVERHRGGIRTRLRADELRPHALRPDAELVDGAGAEGVARGDHHPLPFLTKAPG